MTSYLMLVLGLILLIIGAEFLVRGAVSTAQRLGISALIIGLTIVGWGTSTPELIVSVEGALAGSPGIAVGNVVGSNIFNILFILGISAVVCPIVVSPRAIYRDGSMALFAALVFIAMGFLGGIVQTWQGIAMLMILVGATYYVFQQERSGASPESSELHKKEGEQKQQPTLSLPISAGLIVGGLACLIFGADMLVESAIAIAREYGISETIIGLTLVAAGTSLPELATSVVAALRKQADVALGNVIGSNIYNILGILGVASLWGPIPIPEEIIRSDMWVMLAVTLAVLPAMFLGARIGRAYGAVFLLGYVAYVYYLFVNMTTAGAAIAG